jgi:multicomponent Na+:H+ antiporter subunit D
MMVILAFILLLITSASCFGLSRVVPTRTLGVIAASATFASAVVLVLGRFEGSIQEVYSFTWMIVDQRPIAVTLAIGPEMLAFALMLLLGGSLALLSLALALAPTVYNFGSLFAYTLIAITAVLFGLTSDGVLMAFAWAMAVLSGYTAVQASGVLRRSETLPMSMILGCLATLLLLGGMIVVQPSFDRGELPSGWAAGMILLACLMLMGSAPFHRIFDDYVTAPAALGGLLYGIVFPLLALHTLIQFIWDLGPILSPIFSSPTLLVPDGWRTGLLMAGGVGMVVCTAGAVRESRLRRIIAWQASSQSAMVVCTLGLEGPFAALAAPALVLQVMLTTLVGALAVAIYEHMVGNDDISDPLPERPSTLPDLRIPGILWTFAAISAIGLPPLWGFWTRYWLVKAAVESAAWLVPVLFAIGGMAALAYLVPLGRFWFSARQLSVAAVSSSVSGSVGATTGMGEATTGLSGLSGLSDIPGSSTSPENPTAPSSSPASTASTGPIRTPILSDTYALALSVAALIALIPLLTFGVAPQLAWGGWLQDVVGSPTVLPVSSTLHIGSIVVCVAAIGMGIALWILPWKRRKLSDEDMVPVVLTPDTLASHLTPVAWVGHISSLGNTITDGLMLLQHGVSMLLAPFEQRYYLAGVLFGLVSLVVLMAQTF